MRRFGRIARDAAETALIAILIGLLFRTFVFQVYRVPSNSMEPLLAASDYVVVNKMLLRPDGWWPRPWLPQRPLQRGDVLVFPHPTEPDRLLVKRCVAVGGDHVQIRDKELFRDRELVEEDYVRFVDDRVYPDSTFLPTEYRTRDQFGPLVLAHDELFCLGDNRDQSLDSRHWGAVERGRVVGRATLALRPGDVSRAGGPPTGETGAESVTAPPQGRAGDGVRHRRLFRIR